MISSGGYYWIGGSVIKVLLSLVFLVGFLRASRKGSEQRTDVSDKDTRWFLQAGCILIAYLLVHGAYLGLVVGVPAGQILAGVNSYHGFFPAVLLATLMPGVWKEEQVLHVMRLILPALLILGFTQYLLKSPITPTVSIGGGYEIHSWQFFGRVRAFSLFSSALMYGMYLVFAGGFMMMTAYYKADNRRDRLLALGLALVIALGVYTTMTRLVHLVFFWMIVASFILRSSRTFKLSYWLPMLALVFSGVLTYVLTFGFTNGDGLFSAASAAMRLENWWFHIDQIMHRNWQTLLFGTGVQTSAIAHSDFPVLVDSTPLAMILRDGLLGFLLIACVFTMGWHLLLTRLRTTPHSPLHLAALAFWSSWPVAWSLGLVLVPYLLVFIIVVLVRGAETGDEPTTVQARVYEFPDGLP